MVLPYSGAISLNQIHVEAGGTSGTQVSVNDTDVRAMLLKSSGAQMSFNDWYGYNRFVLTQGSMGGQYTTTYGYKSGTHGSLDNADFYNSSNTLRTVTGIYRLTASAGTFFYLEMSHSTANSIPANEFTRLVFNTGGNGLVSVTAAESSSTSIAGGYQRRWMWSGSYGLSSSEYSSLNAAFDGSGTIYVDIEG